MDLSSVVAPGVALIIALATFILAQVRAQHAEDRAAAKDTVDLLIVQNTELRQEVNALRERTSALEKDRQQLKEELMRTIIERNQLHQEILELKALLSQATALIRADVAENTQVSRETLANTQETNHSHDDMPSGAK